MNKGFVVVSIVALLLLLHEELLHVDGALQFKGHDISSLILLESQGVTYRNTSKNTNPLENIIKSAGANIVRTRVWVNPDGGVYNLDYNIKLAKRVKAAGLSLFVDLHYSDTWADPAHQTPPKSWPTDINGLLTTIKTYTQNVVTTYKNNGISIDIISIGNEIRVGLLWPLGKVAPFTNAAKLLKQASLGVKAAGGPKILIHLDNGWSWDQQKYFYDGIFATGSFSLSDFDMQGVSFYPFFGSGATLANLKTSLTNMANTYKKDILVVETNWPFACSGGPALSEPSIPVSAAGQQQWLTKVADVLNSVPGGRGKGLIYWESGWFNGNTGLGSGCSDAVLFSGDWTNPSKPVGTARPAVNTFASL